MKKVKVVDIEDEYLLTLEDSIIKIMNNYSNEWILNIISLNNNSSYIMYSNNEVKEKILKVLDCYEKNDFLIINPSILRKEIMKLMNND